MSARVVLLGPQFHHPTVGTVLDDLGITGSVATITAGWQEWESEDSALMRQLGGRGVPLRLYERAERVWSADPELREAHHAMQTELRTLRNLYNRQLEAAGEVWVELLGMEGPEHLIGPERAEALRAVQRLDEHLLDRTRAIRGAFEDDVRLHERTDISRERSELRELLNGVECVVIEGGHVAVLLNRLLLFDVESLLGDKMLIGCAGGAMVLSSRVVLYNDQPAIGRGHAEVALPGLGLAPGIVALPAASERLRTSDPARMKRLSLRLAPDQCALLDPGARLEWNGASWTGRRTSRVLFDGSVLAWEDAA
jgi:hypothetical protein